ncbi:MAG: MMPL family transporter [Nanoarchaeota archaeon]
MNEKFKIKLIDIIKSFKVWILIICLLISLLTINYTFDNKGVVINGIGINSLAEQSGISVQNNNLRSLEKITYLDNTPINSQEDYYNYINNLKVNDTLRVITNENENGYTINIKKLNNNSISQNLGISIRDSPSSNIKLGIELEGGSRLILKPLSNITDEQYDLLITSLSNRLDIYGASGTKVNKLEDAFSNDKFIIVESTSSNKNDIYELISRQGKFEAQIGNTTVFTGNDVLNVFTDPQHAKLEGCSENAQGTVCTFTFSIEISSQAGDKFFNKTKTLDVVGQSLSEKITFFLDGNNITSLSIASSFKQQKITNPQISVSGSPMPTRDLAMQSGQKEMKLLQTILSTQSLPSELEVVQSYSISSTLGEKLLENAFLIGFAVILLVSSIIAIRYRHPAIFVCILIALLGEVLIIFGVAAFLKISIDLAAIGGLIAAIGTGVDDQIIITDEYFRKRKSTVSSRKKLKNAIYIIMIAYFTTLAAMLPLMFAGLKMIQGFAFMILIGVTIGVLITRPAYAIMLRVFMTTRKQRKEEDKEDEE